MDFTSRRQRIGTSQLSKGLTDQFSTLGGPSFRSIDALVALVPHTFKWPLKVK
jgi:hypothetical protein